jgi:hypothetical protein
MAGPGRSPVPSIGHLREALETEVLAMPEPRWKITGSIWPSGRSTDT